MLSVAIRQKVEREIIGKFLDDALAAGYRVSVSLEAGHDAEGCELLGSRDRGKLIEAALAGDDCHLFVHEAEGPLLLGGAFNSVGWVRCVLGNDGWDVISDYTLSLEQLVSGANDLADTYSA